MADVITPDPILDASPATVANGGPALEPEPSYAALACIGRAVHGDRWEGKISDRIGENPRTLSRWRVGEGAPTVRTMAWAREWALHTAAEVLAAPASRISPTASSLATGRSGIVPPSRAAPHSRPPWPPSVSGR